MSEETYSNLGLICPHCNHIDRDAWELPDQECGTIECPSCGVEFKWSRCVSISYTGAKLKEGK